MKITRRQLRQIIREALCTRKEPTRLVSESLRRDPINEADDNVQTGWYELRVNSRGDVLYGSGPYDKMAAAQSAIRGKRDYIVGFVTQDIAELYDGFTTQLIRRLPTSRLYDMPTARIAETRSSWRDPINLPSIDSLEAAGRKGMSSYSDIVAAREILPELEEYMEFNYRASLEDAADAWLEAHGYDDPDSPLTAVREMQREFLVRVGRERGLDKI